jgi:hypothetical protein
MFPPFQLLTLFVVVLALAPAVAHVLELPGKMRLSKEVYFAVQRIYYPGFTLAGVSEPLGILLLLIDVALTPHGGWAFWLRLAAFVCFAGMQGIYWIFIHPVNKVWLDGKSLGTAGSAFFAAGHGRKKAAATAFPWEHWRDQWEYAHAARAAVATISFIALVIACLG